MAVAEPVGLGALSREDRALAVVATTLGGREAPEILGCLAPSRAQQVVRAARAYLELPATERLAQLGREATRLGGSPRIEARTVHPERVGQLLAQAPPAVGRVLSALLGTATEAAPQAHPVAIAVARSFLEERFAAAPWGDELSASHESVARLARASGERLLVVAEVLGPARFAAVISSASPTVAGWLKQRLPPEWDQDLAGIEPADPRESLAALEDLTRTAGGAP